MTSMYARATPGVCSCILEWELGGQFQFFLGEQREKKSNLKRDKWKDIFLSL